MEEIEEKRKKKKWKEILQEETYEEDEEEIKKKERKESKNILNKVLMLEEQKPYYKKIILPSISLNVVGIREKIDIPKIVKKTPKRKISITSIRLEKIEEGKILSVPILKRKREKRYLLIPNVKFENIPLSQLLQPLLIKIREEESKESEKRIQGEGGGEEGGRGGIGIEENLLDLFFERKKYGQDIGEVREPYVIFVFSKGEDIKEVVKSIFQRYIEETEEVFEGFKEVSIVGKKELQEKSESVSGRESDRMSKAEERRLREVEENLDVERKVFIINIKKVEDIIKSIDQISLIDRINELKGKRLGFLVFYIEEGEDKIEEKLEKTSYLPNLQIWKVKIVNEEILGRLIGFETKTLKEFIKGEKKILDLDVGNIFFKELERKESFDNLFEVGRKLQMKARKYIRNLVSEIVKRNKRLESNQYEQESDLHYDLKCLTVYYLTENRLNIKVRGIRDIEENYKEITDKIKVEESLPQNQNIIPDVRIDEEVWEIETLFAEGVRAGNPLKKIDETIEKYSNGLIKKINIVLDNLTFYLHFKEIGRKERLWKKVLGKKNIKLEFWIPDWENFALVPISKEIEEIKKILSALKVKEP